MGSVLLSEGVGGSAHVLFPAPPPVLPPPVLPSPAVLPLFPKARAVKLVKLTLVTREKAGGSPFLLRRPLAG